MTSTASIDGRHNVISENAKGSEIRPPLQQKREMSNAYPPCHCLLDSAGYLGLVELLVRRRCQIARRLPGQPGHPDELHKSLVSRPNSTRRVLKAHPRDTNGRESPAVRFFVARRTGAYPSPYAVAQPGPAHHPAKLADPRIGLPTRWRLREAPAPDAIPTG